MGVYLAWPYKGTEEVEKVSFYKCPFRKKKKKKIYQPSTLGHLGTLG